MATDAERLLAAQAQPHIGLERELAQLRALLTALHTAPAALTQRVQGIECIIAVLHAHLAAARQWVATLTHEKHPS